MLVKITERCSMGCIHCMDDAKPEGKDMSMETFVDILDFCVNQNIGKFIMISGGEPTDHPEFEQMMYTLFGYISRFPKIFMSVIVATNGVNILKDPEKYKRIAKCGIETFEKNLGESYSQSKDDFMGFAFQVSADVRYYPTRIELHKRIFREPGFEVFDDRVIKLVNIGRARTNNLTCTSAPSCVNCRLVTRQTYLKNNNIKLSDIEMMLLSAHKTCVPSFSVNGEIKMGESQLCPPAASIYDDDETIIKKMVSFNCKGCEADMAILNDVYKLILYMPIE